MNIYDGNESKDVFTGDMRVVPKNDIDLSTWMSVITFFNEQDENYVIHADLVYLTNPQILVKVRIQAMVVGTNLRDYR